VELRNDYNIQIWKGYKGYDLEMLLGYGRRYKEVKIIYS
jgi:hypothetical protein